MAPITKVGIDVGGERKGFHAVALTDGTTTDQLVTASPRAGGAEATASSPSEGLLDEPSNSRFDEEQWQW